MNNIIDKILPLIQYTLIFTVTFQHYWEKAVHISHQAKLPYDRCLTNDTTHDVKFLNKTYKNISGIWWSMFRVCHDPKQHTQKSVILMGVKSWSGPKKKFYRLTKLKAQKRSCHVVRSTVDWTIGHTLTTGILIRLDHALLCGILGYSDKLMVAYFVFFFYW